MITKISLKGWKSHLDSELTFSKGMNQRFALASSLLHDPILVILDEPSLGLDPRGMIEIREIIRELKNQGKTIFMSSHILSEVQEVCDKIALLHKGKLRLFDEVNKIPVKEKSSKILIETIKSVSDDHLSSIKKFEGVIEIKIESPTRFTVEFSGTSENKAALIEDIQKIGIRLSSFRPIKSDLESIYMDSTSEDV